MLRVNSLIGFGRRYRPPASLVVADADSQFDGANTNSYSFTSVDFGLETAARQVLALVSRNAGTGAATVTIGGQSTTQRLGGSFTNDPSTIRHGLYSASGVSGTSGTIGVSWGDGGNSCSAQCFALYNADPTPAFANANYLGPTEGGDTSSMSVASVTCPPGGAMLVMMLIGANTDTFSGFSGVPGITTAFNLTPDSVYRLAIGIGDFPAGFGPTTITSSFSSNQNIRKMSVVTWGPNP